MNFLKFDTVKELQKNVFKKIHKKFIHIMISIFMRWHAPKTKNFEKIQSSKNQKAKNSNKNKLLLKNRE